MLCSIRSIHFIAGFILLFLYTGQAQNLVPNPSFENYKKDPCQARFRFGYDKIEDFLQNWYVPTGGTTDLYNSDANRKDSCLLFNYDDLKAHTGHYLIALFTSYGYDTLHFKFNKPPPIDTNYREYLQVRLTKPLTVGKIYKAELFTARLGISNFQTNNIGFLFSETPITQSSIKPAILAEPQVVEKNVITDTLWRKISGCFMADKAYQYVTVGNFYDDNHTKMELSGSNPIYAPGSYYYIDDILVEEIPQALVAPKLVDLGTDTTLCPNQSLTLTITPQIGVQYQWQDGSTSTTYVIKQSGTYAITAQAGSCLVTDSLHVTVLPPFQLPPDTTFCQGESLTLQPGYANQLLLWNNGSKDSSLTVSQSGTYWVKLENNTCLISDTIHIKVVDCIVNVPNVFTPNGDGKNEVFRVDNIELLPWRLQIYNRWGARVFESEAYHNEWAGEGLPTGVYYYELFCQMLQRRVKGWVQILR